MIIDNHVHIGRTEKTGRSWSFDSYANCMDTNGVDKAIAMPNISNEISFADLNHEFFLSYLKTTYDVQSRYKLLFLIGLHGRRLELQCEEFSFYIRGFKYHPSVSRVKVSDPVFKKWAEFAEYKDFSILVHCGRDPISHIKYLIDVAKNFPKVTFIAAHMGGNSTDLIEGAIESIKGERVDNICLDTSNGKLPWLVEKAVNVLGKERILFGSDEPYADVRVAKYLIDIANIGTEVKEYILYKNVARIYEWQGF